MLRGYMLTCPSRKILTQAKILTWSFMLQSQAPSFQSYSWEEELPGQRDGHGELQGERGLVQIGDRHLAWIEICMHVCMHAQILKLPVCSCVLFLGFQLCIWFLKTSDTFDEEWNGRESGERYKKLHSTMKPSPWLFRCSSFPLSSSWARCEPCVSVFHFTKWKEMCFPKDAEYAAGTDYRSCVAFTQRFKKCTPLIYSSTVIRLHDFSETTNSLAAP